MGSDPESSQRWFTGLIVGIFFSMVAIAVSLYTSSEQIRIGNKHDEITLYRELIKEFYGDSQDYKKIRMAIERCEPLYKNWGGRFDNDQINSYLGFFEDLGFYMKRDVLSVEVIDQGFGAYIVEAFEYEELKRYIRELRDRGKQSEAFREFESLAVKIEARPALKHETSVAQSVCRPAKDSKSESEIAKEAK